MIIKNLYVKVNYSFNFSICDDSKVIVIYCTDRGGIFFAVNYPDDWLYSTAFQYAMTLITALK